MPVPVKARPPAPATPTTTAGAPEVDVARPPSPSGGTAMARTTADVVRARTQVGNAAVTTALGNLPAGAEPNPAEWAGRMLLAGQDLVGNQVVAKQAAAAPAVPGRQAAKKPEPAAPTRTPTKAPPAPRPELPDKRESERPGKSGRTEDAAGPRSPGADPEFQALKKDVGTTKRRIGSSHPPATAEAGAAQAASVPPADDREARGKAAHAEDMDAAKPKEFDRRAFVQAVEAAIAKRAPKNLDEADKFGDSGKADEVKAEVQGEVAAGKENAAREIADTTAAVPEPAPDAKEVVPLAADKVPGRPGTPNPDRAAPDALPPSATDMSAGPAQVKGQMDAAGVTERQLSFANSREPGFDKAVKDKKALDAHSETAPGRLRAGEAKEIKQVKRTAAAQGAAAMTAMHATRVTTGKQVGTGKQGAKSRDEDKRAVVTKLLQDVFDKTKGDVEKILTDLDKTVDEQFTTEEKRARKKFTEEHTEGMREYKSKRYAGLRGKARWFRDLFAELPEEANQIYVRAKDNYLAAMRGVIGTVADTVERELRRAKDRIATGRKELKTAVDNLPKDLKAIGREAASEFEGRFDELTDSVDEKGTELVDTLATRYTDAVKAVDEEIAAEKEKNKNFFAKAADAIGGAIKTIKELGRMLMGVLRKAASAVGLILRDPVGFLGNLITGVGGGLKLFMRNAGRHLQQGVLAWLLGTGVGAGLQLPTTFDVLGILVMIAGLLGLSWPNLRARLARKVDPRAMAAAETGADAIPIVVEARKRGVAGLWPDLKSRVGDLKKELISKLVSYLLPTIIIAGVTWIVSLFNPASAFIRACKMIIDIIRFIVTQGRQIIEFVNTVLDAVIAIARGGTGGVPALVERALARSIPVLIGALAAILGIGGIAGKVKQIFQALARPVNRAIDWVLDKITALLRKLWAKLKARMDKRRKKRRKPDDEDRVPRRPRARRDRDRRKPKDDRRKPETEDTRLAPAQTPLSMSGASHTLYATPRDGVDIASQRVKVSVKAQRVITRLQNRKRKDPQENEKIASLQDIVRAAKKVERIVDNAEKARGRRSPQLLGQKGFRAAFMALKDHIVKYGSDFGVKDLTEGDLVDQVKLEKEIRADIVAVARRYDKAGRYEDVIEEVVRRVEGTQKISTYTTYRAPSSARDAPTTKNYPKWQGKDVIEGATYFVVDQYDRDSGRTYYILVGDQDLLSADAIDSLALIIDATTRAGNLSATQLADLMSTGMIKAGRRAPELRSRFVGIAVEKYVAAEVASTPKKAPIKRLGAARPGESVPDFLVMDGKRAIPVDVTGGSDWSRREHLQRAYISRETQIITYKTIAPGVVNEIFAETTTGSP